MANPVTVSEEFLRFVADHCTPPIHIEGVHGLIDQLEGAVGRAELERRAKAAAQTPEERAAAREALQKQLAELDASARV